MMGICKFHNYASRHSFFTRFVDFSTGNAYNENGQRASSLWCGWHLKSEIDAGLWAGMLAGNGKTR